MVLWRISPRWFRGTDVHFSGFKLICYFSKTKKPPRKGWFCGEYRPDGSGAPMFILSGSKLFCRFSKTKKPPRKGWFCGEYRPDGSGAPMFIYQVLNSFTISEKQKKTIP